MKGSKKIQVLGVEGIEDGLMGMGRLIEAGGPWVHGYGSGHNHTHLIKQAVLKRLTSLQEKYGGRLIQDGNPGATQWQIARKR